MKVPEGQPTIARRFNGGFRQLKPIESRRDERKLGFLPAISAAPAGLSRFVFTPTVKTVGYFLSSRWDLIYAPRTPPIQEGPGGHPNECRNHKNRHKQDGGEVGDQWFQSLSVERAAFPLFPETDWCEWCSAVKA